MKLKRWESIHEMRNSDGTVNRTKVIRRHYTESAARAWSERIEAKLRGWGSYLPDVSRLDHRRRSS